MYFPKDSTNIINNGINSISHFFNGLFDACVPIEFSLPLNTLFELYKLEATYRTPENKNWLIGISEQVLFLEYIPQASEILALEHEDNEPKNFDKYHSIYIDAYNVSSKIHDYFEKLNPNEFSALGNEEPVIFSGITYAGTELNQLNNLPQNSLDMKQSPAIKEIIARQGQDVVDLFNMSTEDWFKSSFDARKKMFGENVTLLAHCERELIVQNRAFEKDFERSLSEKTHDERMFFLAFSEKRKELIKYIEEQIDILTPQQTVTKIKGLSIDQIALIYFYKNTQITRGNASQIIKQYNYTSGEKLFQRFTYYSSAANRKGAPIPCTPKKLKNKIELFKSVIPHLSKNEGERAKDELKILETMFGNEY